MTEKEFLNKVSKTEGDFLQEFLDLLQKNKIQFCVIGGLAVNAYAEPVVSLDLDVVIVGDKLGKLTSLLKRKYTVKEYPQSINITRPKSDLRIQIQTDPKYQDFIKRAVRKQVLGYSMRVATKKDVLQGKIWAAMDETRRPSKRQKDMADILRLVEAEPSLRTLIPNEIAKILFSG